MNLWVGTSGYSYPGWRGAFYPPGVAGRDMLGAYARRLPAVEINSTFYRLPRSAVLESWAGQVPDAFRFAIKASRRITHFKRLANADGETRYLLDGVGALGGKLGAILFQLHPHVRLDAPRLAGFLDGLPAGLPAAFEFRHRSWSTPEVHDLLARHGCALVCTDDGAGAEPDLAVTADWGYVRLRRETYDDEELAEWYARLEATGWRDALVFFKHEEKAPDLALRLRAVAGA